MADSTLLALLQHRAKPTSRYTARTESFASNTTASVLSDESSNLSHTLFHHPYHQHREELEEEEDPEPEQEDDGQLPPDVDDPAAASTDDDTRMSVMGPKIHKNGYAPWELEPIADETAENSSIFGVSRKSKASRKSKDKEKPPSINTSGGGGGAGGRSRSRTLVETISPVSALKGLGLGKITTYNPEKRPSLGSTRSAAAATADNDDAKSVSTATVTDGGESLYSRTSQALPAPLDHPHAHPHLQQYTAGRLRSKTVSTTGNISIDMGSSSSNSSTTSFARRGGGGGGQPHPPLPEDARKILQLRTSHLPGPRNVRPEDMFSSSFRDSVASSSVASFDNDPRPPQPQDDRDDGSLHPYSNPALLRGHHRRQAAFSDDTATSPSTTEPPLTSSASSFVESPSHSSNLTESHSSGSSPFASLSGTRKKKAPPPPLTLRSTSSSTSLASKRYTATTSNNNGQTGNDASSFYNVGRTANNSSLSVRNTPRPSLPLAVPSTPITAGARTPSSSLSPGNANELPQGMLAFPGSPAYQLISLEQAQAKQRDRSRTTSGREISGGVSGLVARMKADPASPSPQPPMLRQRKSGFLKFFGNADKATLSPNPSVVGSPSIGPPTPLGLTANGLPCPFEANTVVPGPRATPIVLRDRDAIPPLRSAGLPPPPPLPLSSQRVVSSAMSSTVSLATTGTGSGERARSQTTGAEMRGGGYAHPSPQRPQPQPQRSEPIPSFLSAEREEDRQRGGGGPGEPLLRLRHMSTNFMETVPLDYLLSPQDKEKEKEKEKAMSAVPSLSPATPSFNSIASMTSSSVYASSESSFSSPLPTPNSQSLLSPPANKYQHQQQHPQDELEQLRRRVREQDAQIRELKAQLGGGGGGKAMCCAECGSSEIIPLPSNTNKLDSLFLEEVEGLVLGGGGGGNVRTSTESASVVHRPRIPTGYGTRFGSRYG